MTHIVVLTFAPEVNLSQNSAVFYWFQSFQMKLSTMHSNIFLLLHLLGEPFLILHLISPIRILARGYSVTE